MDMDREELLAQYAAGRRDFPNLDFQEGNLSQADLTGINLSGSNLSLTNLTGANLAGADLSHAQLNVARLSGAHLPQANLQGANLKVANLAQANLRGANLMQANLVGTEMIRCDLSEADLRLVDLSGADLREAQLQQANLTGAMLKDADLRRAVLTIATLTHATLTGANLVEAVLIGADLRYTELKQVNFYQANLSGANLTGANLRWVNLQQANLAWSDLSDAKLSGADLSEANLSHANVLRTSLIQADLTGANLMMTDWNGADLRGSVLTGAKLYATCRYGLKVEGIACEWVDLSPQGDRSQVRPLDQDELPIFFSQTVPTVQIVVDTHLSTSAHVALATAYHRIAQRWPELGQSPNLTLNRRRTCLSFPVSGDDQLFIVAYLAILPFRDAPATHRNLARLLQSVQSQRVDQLSVRALSRIQTLHTHLSHLADQVVNFQPFSHLPRALFFQSPTQTMLTNISQQRLTLHQHFLFGKRLADASLLKALKSNTRLQVPPPPLPLGQQALNFMKTMQLTGNESLQS